VKNVSKKVFHSKNFKWGIIVALLAGLIFIGVRRATSPLAASGMPTRIEVSTAQAASSITIDGNATGRIFDGIGAVSGGGGTSRLLYDYPNQQQNQILDYLFKPGYGANLQILKVEIGSDANSTNGAEASHMRSPTDENYHRGYEWWLMQQAKLRNPKIKLYGLEWGAPGWFNGGFWSQDNVSYLLRWIQHAQSDYLLHIDDIGGWNESGYDKTWYENLKAALDKNHLTTQVVGADGGDWSVAKDMQSDAAFNAAVDIVGAHYPCDGGDGSDATTCNSPSEAQALHKQLWASEQGSQNFDSGAPALARALNRDYIDGKMTATINWSLVASWYNTLPDYGMALMQADQPWSGYYHVAKSIWVVAHTTQFVQPGWQYLDSASGYLGGDRQNGSYVTLRSPNRKDYSTIIETMNSANLRTATFQVTGGLSTGPVHVWATNVNWSNAKDDFVHLPDITPSNGTFTITLQPGYIYSLTTTTGQGKGLVISPPSAGLKLPYTDNFKEYPAGALPKYVDSIQGAFEAAKCGGGRTGMCMRQMINLEPNEWPSGSHSPPIAVVGDPSWSDYQVSIDALLEQSGHIDLIGHSGGVSQSGPGGSQGYHLQMSDSGKWTLLKEDGDGKDTTLASGTGLFPLNSWHKLSLRFEGNTIQASIDSQSVATVNDPSYSSGQVGLLVSKWQNAQFDNFSVIPGPGGNEVSINDSVQGTGTNQFNYVGSGWQHNSNNCQGNPCEYNNDNSWDNTTNDYVTVSFTGVQIKFYGVLSPGHGIGAVSIDGGSETMIDFYVAKRAGNQLMWTSPKLSPGSHTFKLRVTGTKNASSSDTFVALDRVAISN